MGVGALATYGRQPDYRGYEATGNRQIDAFYGGMSSAANKAETESVGEVLGLTTIPYSDTLSYGMTAKYSEASAAADPIVQVSCNYGGERRVFDVHVNDVDPRNASQIEMFALCCYTDDKGITDGGSFGSYSKMKTIAGAAAYGGRFADLQDPANVGGSFDWVSMLEEMADAYLGNPVAYDLYLDATNLAAALGKWSDTHSMDFEKTLSCRYAAESTEKDPVVEVSWKRHGETVREKIHLNDVNPRKATQQEMCALFYHQDQVDGTEGSYERMMQYAQTAKKHGYWDGNESYEDFSEVEHDWSDMLVKVLWDCRKLGLEEQASECSRLNVAMFRVMLQNIDLKQAKPVDMREKTTLTPPELKLPDIPMEIAEAFAGILYEEFKGRKFSNDKVNDIWFEMEHRIEKALNENGGRESIGKAWDVTIAALEDMLAELEDYFGNELADDPAVREAVGEMRNFYQTVIREMKSARENALGAGQSSGTKEEEESENDLRNMLIDYVAEMYSKMINGDMDQEFAIGSIALTIEEWEKLIDKLDEIEEEIRTQIKEEIRKIKEAEGIVGTQKEPIDESTVLTSEIVENSFGTGTAADPAPSYITCFTAEGIICTKKGCAFGQYLWKMDYQNEGDYEKVMGLLHSFPSDWNLRFASNESFWKDYLEDKIDQDDFIQHMNEYTDKGNPNYLIERDGSTYINRDALKYSRYLNDPETRMYTAEEFRNLITAQMEKNKRKGNKI